MGQSEGAKMRWGNYQGALHVFIATLGLLIFLRSIGGTHSAAGQGDVCLLLMLFFSGLLALIFRQSTTI